MTWLPLAFLLLGPVYQAAEATVGPEGTTSRGYTSTLVDVNGWRVLPLLLAPVGLTAAGIVGASRVRAVPTTGRPAIGRVILWVSAVLLLGFCAVGVWTIGLFYLPAALALAGAAAVSTQRYPP